MVEVHPARVVDLPGVAAILQEAFDDKMRIIFSREPEKVRSLLEAVYSGPIQRGYDGVLVAEHNGRIIGTVLIEPIYHTPDENRAFEHFAVHQLGMPRMLWAAFLLWLLSHTPEPDEAYISDLGVAEDCRGKGVGQLLLEYAAWWAREHDRQQITLWVAATNTPALYLYEKVGFTVKRTRSSLLTRATFGIRRWYFMEKRLYE
jgi:ribosomal protein S18 acetylase RimI-like enzyme